MKITPLDIRRKEFKRSMRGYSDEEVDVFLDEVADEFERLFQENMELQDRVHRLDEQVAGHAQLKDALEKTLISAQLQAEELRANAHKETELILRDAELKARGIVSDSYGETQRVQQALVQLKLLEEDFRIKFRSLLEGYLRLVNEAPPTPAGPEPEVQAPAAMPEQPAAAAEAEPQPAVVAPPAPFQVPETPAAEAADEVTAEEEPQPTAPPWSPPAQMSLTPPAPEPYPVPPLADSPAMAPEIPTTPVYSLPDDTAETAFAPRTEAVAPPAAPASSPPWAEDPTAEEEPTRGFFFGRKLDDTDDSFPADDGAKKDKTRDFEW